MPPHDFNPAMFSSEIIFTVTAVTFCLLIYFKTRESYQLTRHKGIKFFRDAFLFFGLSYSLRFILALFLISVFTFDFEMIVFRPMPLFILLTGYFSTIGICYLIFSSMWKKFGSKYWIIGTHLAAILVSAIAFITRSHLILLYLQCALLVVVVLLRFIVPKEKKISQIKLLYFLVALVWIINLLVIEPKRRMPFEFDILFQTISIIVFAIIYHKVSKWVK
jgi:hypothetical protein